MTLLKGADSATPKIDRITDQKVWGVYVAGATFHVWTHGEVASLAQHGVEGVIPIVLPPQNENWWELNEGYAVLEELVREALAWGVPAGSPLCLDIEQHQASAMGAKASNVAHAWAVATRSHGLRTWTYSGHEYLAYDMWGVRWLAEWPNVIPTNPQLPVGFAGWQYHGTDNGIDHDIFEAGRDYLSPELQPVVIGTLPDVDVPGKPDHDTIPDHDPVVDHDVAGQPDHDISPDPANDRSVGTQSPGDPAGTPAPAETPGVVSPPPSVVSPLDPAVVAALAEIKAVVSVLMDIDNGLHDSFNRLVNVVTALEKPETDDEVPKS
jgi:hypothetical protein